MKTKEILESEFLEAAEKERDETEGQKKTDQWKRCIIRYEKMQSRPSVTIKVKEQEVECLLDTDATVGNNILNLITYSWI